MVQGSQYPHPLLLRDCLKVSVGPVEIPQILTCQLLHHFPACHTMVISCVMSNVPNGWTDGGFIIQGFLPKSSPVLLQFTTGAPTLRSAAAHVVLQLPVSLGAQEARPEPPYLVPLQLMGATLSELLQGRVGLPVLF